MKISQKGIDFIKQFEGFVSKPYLCPAKVWSIGYGTTVYPNGKKVAKDDIAIDEAMAIKFLTHDVNTFTERIDGFTTDNLTQSMADAIISFAYNVGTEGFRKSTLLKVINSNPKDPRIKKEFQKWVFADGKKVGGLIRRRKDEANMYFEDL